MKIHEVDLIKKFLCPKENKNIGILDFYEFFFSKIWNQAQIDKEVEDFSFPVPLDLQISQDRGLELLRILLCDNGLPEEVRSEAAGVVAQITSPGFCKARGKHPLGQSLKPLVADLVRSLTRKFYNFWISFAVHDC